MEASAPGWARDLLHDSAAAVREAVLEAVRREPQRLGEVLGVGADGTDTKYVDQVADDAFLAVVRSSGRSVRVLSEESGWSGEGDWALVVDPLDGTRNAAHRVPFYCVSVGLGRRRLSDVVMGIVVNVPTGETFFAEAGEGAALDGRPIETRDLDPREIYVAAVQEDGFPSALRAPHRHFRDMGASALEMSLVAAGSFDLYVHRSPKVRIIDIAASTLIVREAGGLVRNAQGGELEMPYDLAAKAGVVAASGEAVLQELAL